MTLPFLHKFRKPSCAGTATAIDLSVKLCEWPLSMIGPDGPQVLNFEVLGVGESAPRRPGIFVYAKRSPDGQWQALYIGETANLHNRLSFNEIAADALLSGATDIHVLLLDVDAKSRRDLCEKFVFTNQPTLNEHRARHTTPRPPKTNPGKRPSSNAA